MGIFTKLIRIFCLGVTMTAAANTVSTHDGVAYRKEAGVAQYKGSDYKNAIRVERNISLKEAFEIANLDPDIDYFVYMIGECMVLEIPPDVRFDPWNDDPLGLVTHTRFMYDNRRLGEGYCRVFNRGDTVFFNKEGQCLGSAHGYADAYFKE